MDAADETDKSRTGEEEEEKSKSSGSMSSIADAELPSRWFFFFNSIESGSLATISRRAKTFLFFRLLRSFWKEEGAARIRSLC